MVYDEGGNVIDTRYTGSPSIIPNKNKSKSSKSNNTGPKMSFIEEIVDAIKKLIKIVFTIILIIIILVVYIVAFK